MVQALSLSSDGRGLPQMTSVVLRPIAAPLPMGFLALAVGSFVLAGFQLHWIGLGQSRQVALCVRHA
jgi:uncharacterized protein